MSKELEAFRKICKNLNSYEFTDEYKNNKKLIEKELKAFEIIKECCIVAKYPDNTYELGFCKKILIDKDEYDLLKEVLCDE